mmetsp:Transcript_7142/g.28892  ORF Transcript_7142/g.28892 Transcript_7142/m.28892 type:complete len:220 (+) Transcript_7142:413-1072(+)
MTSLVTDIADRSTARSNSGVQASSMTELAWETNDVPFRFADSAYFIAACVAAALTTSCALSTALAVIAAVASSTAASVAASTAKSTRRRRPGTFCKKARCSACLISVEEDFKSIDGIVASALSAFGEVTPKVGESVFLASKTPPKSCACVDLLTEVGSTRCGCACIRRGTFVGCDGVCIKERGASFVSCSFSSTSACAMAPRCFKVRTARSTLGHTVST